MFGVRSQGFLALFQGQLSLFVGILELQHTGDEIGRRFDCAGVFEVWRRRVLLLRNLLFHAVLMGVKRTVYF